MLFNAVFKETVSRAVTAQLVGDAELSINMTVDGFPTVVCLCSEHNPAMRARPC